MMGDLFSGKYTSVNIHILSTWDLADASLLKKYPYFERCHLGRVPLYVYTCACMWYDCTTTQTSARGRTQRGGTIPRAVA